MKALIPHFAVPFHFHEHGDGMRAHEVEQGTGEEIFGSIEVILRYPKGHRPEYPDFGITDLTFEEQPLPVDDLKEEVLGQDARAEIAIATAPTDFDELVAYVRADLITRGVQNE